MHTLSDKSHIVELVKYPAPPRIVIKKEAKTAKDKRTEYNHSKGRANVLRAIAQGATTSAAISKKTGIMRKTAQNRCAELFDEGLIRRKKVKGEMNYLVTGKGLLSMEMEGAA